MWILVATTFADAVTKSLILALKVAFENFIKILNLISQESELIFAGPD